MAHRSVLRIDRRTDDVAVPGGTRTARRAAGREPRLHLDVEADGREAEVARPEAAGARVMGEDRDADRREGPGGAPLGRRRPADGALRRRGEGLDVVGRGGGTRRLAFWFGLVSRSLVAGFAGLPASVARAAARFRGVGSMQHPDAVLSAGVHAIPARVGGVTSRFRGAALPPRRRAKPSRQSDG